MSVYSKILFAFFVTASLCHAPIFSAPRPKMPTLPLPNKPKAVTYDLGGGRFGDQLLGYLHAKWISYRYGMPLLFKPFPYSEFLYADTLETHYSPAHVNRFDTFVRPAYKNSIDYTTSASTLFIIPYFPENLWEHTPQEQWYYFPVDWEDAGFKAEIKKTIAPKHFTPQLPLPVDRLAVAVHMRLGGGFDTPDTWKKIPLKLPPISYYGEQLVHLYHLLDAVPLYVHIFTDDKDPECLLKQMQEYTEGLDIEYGCRERGNAHDAHIIDDFFEMARFEYLIRPDSNFSIVVSKIADFKIVISPLKFEWTTPDTGRITETEIHYSKN